MTQIEAAVRDMPTNQNTVTPQEAARALKWSVRAVYAQLYNGRLHGVRDTGRWKIPVEEINKRRGV
jgi:hypothetical protein